MKWLDGLDFAIHQLSHAMLSIMSLQFTRPTIESTMNDLDQLKVEIGRWGLKKERCEELICAISHVQRALEVEVNPEIAELRARESEAWEAYAIAASRTSDKTAGAAEWEKWQNAIEARKLAERVHAPRNSVENYSSVLGCNIPD